jgi:hypothetical protein
MNSGRVLRRFESCAQQKGTTNCWLGKAKSISDTDSSRAAPAWGNWALIRREVLPLVIS